MEQCSCGPSDQRPSLVAMLVWRERQGHDDHGGSAGDDDDNGEKINCLMLMMVVVVVVMKIEANFCCVVQ